MIIVALKWTLNRQTERQEWSLVKNSEKYLSPHWYTPNFTPWPQNLFPALYLAKTKFSLKKQPIGDVKLYNMPKLAPILPISSSQQNPSWWKLGEMFLDASRHENLSMIANSCLGKVEFNFLATCKSENRWREHFSSPPLLQKRVILQLCSFSAIFCFVQIPNFHFCAAAQMLLFYAP